MDIETLKLTPKRKQICQRLNLNDSDDVLRYYPSRYERYEKSDLNKANKGDLVVVYGKISSAISRAFVRRNLKIIRFKLLSEGEDVNITVFNQPWLKIQSGEYVTVIGHYDGSGVNASKVLNKPIEECLGIQAIYPLKEGIRQSDIKNLIKSVYDQVEIKESIEDSLIEKHGLISLKKAIEEIHWPSDEFSLKKAIARLKYEEFLIFYIALNENKRLLKSAKETKNFKQEDIDSFIASLPFSLTQDQKKASIEILSDLKKSERMNRLLQGDVGCGKTVVAAISLYANYLSGYQGALMAPTEILAQQHYNDLKEMFKRFGVKVGLLTSKTEDSKELKESISNNDIDIVVGTHSLFSEKLNFNNLGLVITDEQHRFGVMQRKKLKEKGENVDVLMMSATPIPRTLASTLYGDMDISNIYTLPANRKKCNTILIKKNSLADIKDDLFKYLEEKRQIYIICASVNENEAFDLKDVNRIYLSLKDLFTDYKLAMLHGKMESDEKEKTMNSFAKGEVDILVATTVVEVGVNVPNATVMVIYDSDRFGMSQLHQLRGRVKRGQVEGYCYLLTGSSDELALKRLEMICEEEDGFKIAQADLSLRGPGDVLGYRQSGLPSFILGNPLKDDKIIEAAKEDAKSVDIKNYQQILEKYSLNS